jgi:hypothetical protein
MKIKGKVADLIDNRTLIINKGSKAGVKDGMIFMVYDATGKTVIDPETGSELGKIKLPKIEVKVTHADDKYSIAETYKYNEVNEGGVNPLIGMPNVFSPPKYVKKYETFDIEPFTKKQLDKEKSIVKVGDTVEQVSA